MTDEHAISIPQSDKDIHFNGAPIISGVIAAVCEPWTLFAVMAVAFIIGALAAGDIRLNRRR